MNKIDNAVTALHNFADQTQYSSAVYTKSFNEKDGSELEIFVEQINENYRENKGNIFELFPEKENEIKNAISPMQNILKSFKENKETADISEQLEESFLTFIIINKELLVHKKKMLDFSLYVSLGILLSLLIIIFFVMRKILLRITMPLEILTNEANSLSLSTKGSQITLNNSFYEYEVLTGTFQLMSERLLVQNKITSNESGANKAGELAENLAHTINNPLAIIGTSAKLIERMALKVSAENIIAEAKEIMANVTRITDTSHQIKTLIYSSDKVEYTKFQIRNIVSALNLLHFSRLFNNDIELIIEANEDEYISGKESIVLQVVSTLIQNTIDFLINDSDKSTNKNIVLKVKSNSANNTVIEILDNGSSIEQEVMLSYFKDASSQKMNFYAANELATKNDYALHFESKPEKKFILTL
jgi:C4-dicarboxylate-specific signal transduction histidine kinase